MKLDTYLNHLHRRHWQYCHHQTLLCLPNNFWHRVVDAATSIWPMVSSAAHSDRRKVTDYCLAIERRCVLCNRVALFLDPATICGGIYRNGINWGANHSFYTVERTMYDVPLSVPASHGYNSTSLRSVHLQSVWQSSRPETPTNQSGDGNIIDTNDSKWWSESTRNTANVLPVIFG